MNSHRKNPPYMTNTKASFAAPGVLAAGLALALCAACNPSASPTTSPPSPPGGVDPDPGGKPGFGAPDVWPVIAPGDEEEYERMARTMRETKPGGCDPPALLPFGKCEQLGTCDSFPFLSGKTAEIYVSFSPLDEVPPGATIDVELIKCDATPSRVMTRSQEIPKQYGEQNLSVPTEPMGKYLLRLTNKAPALRLSAFYQVGTPL